MAVLTFKEIHSGRDGDESEGGEGGRIVRRYSRVFRGVTDDNADDAAVVLSNPLAPRYGSQHNKDALAFCRRRRARNESFSKNVWLATFAYSTEFELEEDPTADPVRISWNTEQFQKQFYRDRDGKALLNTAGDPPDPLTEGDDSRWTVRIVKNLSAVPVWLLAYKDVINNNPFIVDGVSVPAKVAKVQSIAISEEQERNDIMFRTLTLGLHFKPDTTWDEERLNEGLREKRPVPQDPSTFVVVNIVNDDGTEPSAPVLLDENGLAIKNPNPEDAHFIPLNLYSLADFNILPGILPAVP